MVLLPPTAWVPSLLSLIWVRLRAIWATQILGMYEPVALMAKLVVAMVGGLTPTVSLWNQTSD